MEATEPDAVFVLTQPDRVEMPMQGAVPLEEPDVDGPRRQSTVQVPDEAMSEARSPGPFFDWASWICC